jgi:methyl-accepting chemotaxis protein
MASTLASATIGITDKNEIHRIYSTLIRDVRFFPDESGYFFIYEGSVNFILPIKPELEGKDLINLTDANGLLVIKELEEAVQSGGGYFEYLWDKPGKGNQPKLSYAQMIPNSPYSIGTGVYIDNIQEKETAILNGMNNHSNSFLVQWAVVLLLAFFIIILPVIIFMIKSMTSPLVRLTEVASEYSKGTLETEIEYTERQDEIGALSRAIKRLGSSTRMVMKKLEDTDAK